MKAHGYELAITPFAPAQWLLDDPKYQELSQQSKDGVLAFLAEREREFLFGNRKSTDPQPRGILSVINPKVSS